MKECVRCGEKLPNHGPYCLHSNKSTNVSTTEYRYINGILTPVKK